MVMDDFSFMILKAVVSFCVALVTAWLIPYLDTLRNDKRFGKVIDMIAFAVRAAEQTVTDPKSGQIKKDKVVQFINSWLKKENIVMTDAEINELIESAVYSMKKEG